MWRLRRSQAMLSSNGSKQTTARRQNAPPLGRGHMAKSIPLTVNGKSVKINADDPDMPLLYALRDNLGLHGPRFGCGLGQCGACTVHVDGKAVRSCQVPVSSLTAKQKVVTLEGLAQGKKLHRVQQALDRKSVV